ELVALKDSHAFNSVDRKYVFHLPDTFPETQSILRYVIPLVILPLPHLLWSLVQLCVWYQYNK
uniref:Uncharacterized protein n=2 Tax=Amphimedon queenslandica TaxID=400682 RepID=A0A1X7TKX7_AMPQE